MGGKFEVGRIAGLPVVIDFSFILLILLWGHHYFTSGNSQLMSAGFVIVIGLALSILIHEFAHAVAGHAFGVRASHVELNGMGGLCFWASPMRKEAWPRIAISVAGPLSNLALYYLFRELAALDALAGNRLVRSVLLTLSSTNFLLFVFNLLPAYPLDGGKALEALLGTVIGDYRAMRFVAVVGLAVTAWLVSRALQGDMFLLLIAALLGITNWQALEATGGPPFQRR
jgi:Zn-dependent protease